MHRSVPFCTFFAASMLLLTFANLVSPATARGASPDHPAGWSDLSFYLPMRDGTRIAVGLWYPGGHIPDNRVPVVLVQTRYGRAGIFIHSEGGHYSDLLKAGYAVAVVDTRGSTASFGPRNVELSPEELSDMDELIRYFKSQPWSNGEVFATGVSYMADTADLATASPAHLTGAVIREADFDAYLDLFYPGGVSNDFMMTQWGDDTIRRDLGRSVDPSLHYDCMARVGDCAKIWPRLQPVDSDGDFRLVREAIAGRKHWQPDDYRDVSFRDDPARNGFTLFQLSPAAHLPAIAREAVPAQYWGSWMDAGTADSALTRYRSLPRVPMQVWITANNHGGDTFSDPFFPGDAAPLPGLDTQWSAIRQFLSDVRAHRAIPREIHYYVLGTKQYETSSSWPPKGFAATEFRFAPDHRLAPIGPRNADGLDTYRVDFTATTGEATRWTAQLGVAAAYKDRRPDDAKLLTYTSAPFPKDMELAGTPVVTLYVATATSDPAFFVYLEDVAPDGRVTYITEGLFRALNRKPAEPGILPYAQDPPASSFLRKDAMPMPAGVATKIAFPTYPVAVLIRKGHSLRVAIAGADASTFRRYSDGKPDTWTIARTADQPSGIMVPLRSWMSQ